MCAKKNDTKIKYIRAISERNEILNRTSESIAFNLKFFQCGDSGGQSFEDWQREEILADLNNKLKDFSGRTIFELKQNNILEIYTEYPKDSSFLQPAILSSLAIDWGRLRIKGLRRLIGFFYKKETLISNEACKNVFYIVFLDKKHDFAPSVQR